MGLLEDCRVFLSKYTNNAILIGVISYIIIKYINNMDKKEGFEESFSENIKIIQKDKSGEIIFDTQTGYYSLLINGNYIKSAKTLSTLKSNKESYTVVAKNYMNETPVKIFNTKEEAEDFINKPYNKLAYGGKYIIRKEGINMDWREKLNKIYKESFKEKAFEIYADTPKFKSKLVGVLKGNSIEDIEKELKKSQYNDLSNIKIKEK